MHPHPVALACGASPEAPAATVTSCQSGCGTFLHAESGRIYDPSAEPARTDCPYAAPVPAPSPEVGGAAAAGSACVLPSLTEDDAVTLLRASAVPSQQDLLLERDRPHLTFGDPAIRPAQKTRDSVDQQFGALAELLSTRCVALLAAALGALQALPQVQRAALPAVDLRPALTPAATQARPVPFAAAIAAALQAALSALGVATMAGHAHAAAPIWKQAAAPAFVFDAAGAPQSVSFYWSTLARMLTNDDRVRLPRDLYAAPASTSEALAPLLSEITVRAHGPLAGVTPMAARIGLLRACRRNPLAQAPLAWFWAAWHAALTSAAEHARKEYKALVLAAPRAPQPRMTGTGGLAGGGDGQAAKPAAAKAGGKQAAQRTPCPHCKRLHPPPCRWLAAAGTASGASAPDAAFRPAAAGQQPPAKRPRT